MIGPPQVDDRTSADFVRQVRELLQRFVPDPPPADDDGELVNGLVGVFGRFCEITADRINRAPEKHFLAFLQMLGLSNRPPQAAQVPLTFYLSAENAPPALVKERTQLAAQLLGGETKPVLFETDRPLVVVPHKFNAMFAFDGGNDTYADLSLLLPQTPPAPASSGGGASPFFPPQPAFTGDSPVPHRLYIALRIASPLKLPLDGLRIRFDVDPSPTPSARGGKKRAQTVVPNLQWRLLVPHAVTAGSAKPLAPEPADFLASFLGAADPFTPTEDTTNGLTQSGEIFFANVPPSPTLSPTGDHQYWIEGRLLTPIALSDTDNTDKLNSNALPTVQSVGAAWEVNGSGLPLELAFANAAPVDLTKDFFPFGESPKFGDTLYLASDQLFSRPNTDITLSIEITNPAGEPGSTLPAAAPDKVRLAWEFFDGAIWCSFGVAGGSGRAQFFDDAGAPASADAFSDTTNALSTDGEVSFRIARPPVPTLVNGKRKHWIRVRLVAGNYGLGPHYEGKNTFVPASFAPPVIGSLQARFEIAGDAQPFSVVSYNNFTYAPVPSGQAFQPFTATPAEDAHPALYLGFAEPASPAPANPHRAKQAHTFPTEPLSLYLAAERTAQGISSDPSTLSRTSQWEFWNGDAWAPCPLVDGTAGLCHPGIVRFAAPPGWSVGTRFGLARFWLRASAPGPEFAAKVSVALLNTVMATAGTSILNEVLGVSTGEPGQTFRLLQGPVLPRQQLEVLEPHLPGAEEQSDITGDEGEGAIQVISHSSESHVVRVRWHPVADFYASGPRDRHYLLDRLTGAVLFGDGTAGQIPPRGAKVVMSPYRTGGGAVSNRPALNISQLKTAVPYIKGVCNWIAAGGGGDLEEISSVMRRGSTGLRHRNRAVTAQDFEDLALLASPEVARAKCSPAHNLLESVHRKPGAVTVFILPNSADPRPQPGAQLLDCVLDALQGACLPTVSVIVEGPTYIEVNVATEIVVEDPDVLSSLGTAVEKALGAFLHPLTGGLNGGGWDFGSRPHRSQFYALLERLPGVRYIRDVHLEFTETPPQSSRNLSLVSPGKFTISASMEA